MITLIAAALSRARTVLTSLLLILIAGMMSYHSIPKEAAPDVNIPIIYVSMTLQGISPEDAERLLIVPMEKELRSVEGIKEMRSTAYEGGANVLMEFEAGFDADVAMQDVRQQVDRAKPELPEDADEPTVNEVNVSLFPVVVVTMGGDVPERTLLKLAQRLQDRIETIPSVLEAKIGGDREEQVDIIISPELISSYGLSATDLAGFLARNNKLVAAGAIDSGQGRFSIKVPGLLETAEDILNLPLKVSGDAVITIRDVAEVRGGFKDPDGRARINGKPGLTLSISKRIGTNIIETVDAVKAVVEDEKKQWPETLDAHITQDQSQETRSKLIDLQNGVVTSVLLVMIMVVATLGFRSGILVGIAIPGSFLMGILALNAMGLTMNMVVLFGLILAVGMLVDGAIVVTEYADRRMIEGAPRKQAYAEAAQRMAWPVIASTATTLAAFLPLAFWTGVVGEFIKYLPITLLATLTASLVMALIFVPTLGAYFGKPGEASSETMKALTASETGDLSALSGFTGRYVRIMQWALRHPGKIALSTVGLLIASQVLYAAFGRGVQFFPEIEPKYANVLVHARGNLSLDEKEALVVEAEKAVLGRPEIASVYTLIGKGAGTQDSAPDLIGQIGLEFTDWGHRRSVYDVLADIRQQVSQLAGVEIEVSKAEEGPPVGKPVQVQIVADRSDLLQPAAHAIRAQMDKIGGFVDFEDTSATSGIDWEITVDRAQAAKFGMDVQGVGDMVRMVTRGLKVSDYLPDGSDEEVDIAIRYPEENRTLEQLDHLFVNNGHGAIALSSFISRNAVPKTGEIRRSNGHRVVLVKADVAEGLLVDDQVQKLKTVLTQDGILPKGVRVTYKGEDEEQEKSKAFLGKAFLVALFMISIILVTQFNSFYSTILVLSAIVMSTIGVFLGLLLFQEPFGIIMSGIGVISLAGIVVNNNIVLIDTFDQLVKEIPSLDEAIIRTGAQRLRPVMLTTGTTILGLLPMMFTVNVDFVNRDLTVGAPSMQWWSQLSMALVCGLTFATVLTLVVTPCLLKLRGNIAQWWQSKRRQS